jgi:predicted Fe-Mo cluster-binding NifX family protein
MRVAFSVRERDQNARLGAPFGRCRAYVVVDTETDERRLLSNPVADINERAGIAAAEFIVRQNIDVVISGLFGAKASRILAAGEVAMCRAVTGTISEFLARPRPEEKTRRGIHPRVPGPGSGRN